MSASVKMKKEEVEKKPRRRIKKVAGHGGHHGGSWKVAYADFVTAMMALFLVLWLLSQADTKLKESVANYFRSDGVFSSQSGGILKGPKKPSRNPSADSDGAGEMNMFQEIAGRLRKELDSRSEFKGDKDRVKIEVTKEGLRIQIMDRTDRVTFESGRAELNPITRAILLEIAKEICKLPNSIAIGGHTDKALFPAGSSYTNWELSADRANAARRALESGCVRAEQVHRVIGYADTELAYPNQPFAAANRRITIQVLSLSTAAANEVKNEVEKKVEEAASPKEAASPSPTPTEPKAKEKADAKGKADLGKVIEPAGVVPTIRKKEQAQKAGAPPLGSKAKEETKPATK